MKRTIQLIVSLALLYAGSVISVFHAGIYSARLQCDGRYQAHIEALRTNLLGAELEQFFDAKGQDRYADYSINFLTFKPSGKLYSGSAESGSFIVGGAAMALLGVAGILDTLRRKKALIHNSSRMPNKSPEPTAVGAVRSAIAVHVASRRWLGFFRSGHSQTTNFHKAD